MKDEKHYFEWQDHDEIFHVHFIHKGTILLFKLMPLGIQYKESYGVDGLFNTQEVLDFSMLHSHGHFIPTFLSGNPKEGHHMYMWAKVQ